MVIITYGVKYTTVRVSLTRILLYTGKYGSKKTRAHGRALRGFTQRT